MSVNLKELARRLGMAPSTVSRALKNHPDISEKTKKAVRELAAQLNYVPDTVAWSLRSRKSRQIAMIVPEIARDFFATVISAAERAVIRSGYSLVIFQSSEDSGQEQEVCRIIEHSGVAGVLASVARTTRNTDHFRSIQAKGIPLLFFDRIAGDIDTDRVVTDDFGGAYLAVEHLIHSGRKRIMHLASNQYLQIAQKRKMGYTRALQDNGIVPEEEFILLCDDKKFIDRELSAFIRRLSPDAVFAFDDMMAAACMQILKKGGYKIPGDVAVCGFSNSLLASYTEPGLTTVEQEGTEIGRVAVEMLLERIDKSGNRPTVTKVLKNRLIVRGSTGSV